MIKRIGDVFNTDAHYIGHGVNCIGVMGAGIAKTIREKYPKTYQEYRWVCEADRLIPGGMFVFKENDKVIVNLATQFAPGPDARYDAVFNALYKFSSVARAPEKIALYGNRIAIPQIGCGIGGLEWDKVTRIIETVELLIPEIEYETWTFLK